MKRYDMLIVGGGPIGIACGIEASKQGLSYVIIEKGTIVNSLFNYPVNMQFFSSSDLLEIDAVPFITNEAKPRRNDALEYYRRIVADKQLNIHLFEKVLSINKNQDFSVQTTKNQYLAKNIVLATGFYDIPKRLGVPGENLQKVSHYYKDPHYYSQQRLLVVGASNSAVDAALECWQKGAVVHMVIRGAEIGKRVKYWVRPNIENRIKEGSIKAYFNSEVREIKEDKVIIQTPNKIVELHNDFILALTGYQPDFIFLENLGVAISNDEKRLPKYNSTTMETNVPGLYLAGVICGGMETHKWFIENSRQHAGIIAKNISDKL